jgi:short-subunit dehydrogenase
MIEHIEPGAAPGGGGGVCVIVGAGPGLGSALARRFAAQGYALGLINRTPDPMQALMSELTPAGTVVATKTVDVADGPALAGALARFAAQLGPVDVLIYNAASATYLPPSRLPPGALDTDLAVNVTAALTASQAVLPGMRAAGAGTILLTGGGAALDPAASMGSLPMTKAALRALAFVLNDELTAQGIHVGTVTIAGTIGDDPDLAPARIAETFWAMHSQGPANWSRETIHPDPG